MPKKSHIVIAWNEFCIFDKKIEQETVRKISIDSE